MNKKMIIALDPGYGNTKVVANGDIGVVQSAVARPVEIGQAATGMKAAKIAIEVGFGNHVFVVGPGSWRWGEPIGSMDYADLASPARKALFYAGIAAVLEPGKHEADLVIGLPVPLLQDELQAQMVFSGLRAYKGHHTFMVEEQAYQVQIKRIKVLAQPVGAWADWLLNEDLHIRRGMGQAEVAILDLGMNTLDLYVIQGGEVSPRFVGGDKVGVRRLLSTLNGHGEDLVEIDDKLRSGKIDPTIEELDIWLAAILGVLEEKWPKMKRFSAVVPTGGGAVVLGEPLRNTLVAKGAAVHWPENPIAANAVGLWKWGCRELR